MQLDFKDFAEHLLRHGGPAAIARKLHRGRGLVLAYHNVVPDGEALTGDTSLHLPQRQFVEQLDILLEEGISVEPLEDVMSATWNKNDSRRHIAITFDDAYSGAVDLGINLLVQRGLPATIFVVPGMLDGQTFWWDALSAPDHGLSEGVRNFALSAGRGRNDEVIHWARRQGIAVRSVSPHLRTASVAELRVAAAQPGISLASHTWSHPNLSRLTEPECRTEFARAVHWLNNEFGLEPGWLSYPYGLHSPAAERAASTVGHVGGMRIDGGWLPREHADPFRMPRFNVPAGISRAGFSLRVSGLLTE